jgi:hypothetical protein
MARDARSARWRSELNGAPGGSGFQFFHGCRSTVGDRRRRMCSRLCLFINHASALCRRIFQHLRCRVAGRGAFCKVAKAELLATPGHENDRLRFYQLEPFTRSAAVAGSPLLSSFAGAMTISLGINGGPTTRFHRLCVALCSSRPKIGIRSASMHYSRSNLETIIMEATQTMNAIRSHHRGGSETLVYEPVCSPPA